MSGTGIFSRFSGKKRQLGPPFDPQLMAATRGALERPALPAAPAARPQRLSLQLLTGEAMPSQISHELPPPPFVDRVRARSANGLTPIGLDHDLHPTIRLWLVDALVRPKGDNLGAGKHDLLRRNIAQTQRAHHDLVD